MMRTETQVRVGAAMLSRIATPLAIMALSAVLAYWTWAWLGPREQPRAPAWTTAHTGAAAATLFDAASAERHSIPGSVAASMTLIGVAAASRKTGGYALVQIGGMDTLVVREGAEIEPGTRLIEVQPDRIVLERAGARETIAWPESDTAPLAHSDKAVPGRTPPAAASAAPSGQATAGAVVGPPPTKAERDRMSD